MKASFPLPLAECTQLNRLALAHGVTIAYRANWPGADLRGIDAVIMLHGIAETGTVFEAWLPEFGPGLPVILPDLRGYGLSSPVAEDAALTITELGNDITGLVKSLGLSRVHLVGNKLGAQIALYLASQQPVWLASMTLAGVLPSPAKALGPWLDQWLGLIDREGVAGWARATMPGRMGSAMDQKTLESWTTYMGNAPAATVKACLRMLPTLDQVELEAIRVPTLMIAAARPGDASQYKQQQPVSELARWIARIPDAVLAELEADSYHVGATHPAQCARLARLHITRHASGGKVAAAQRSNF